MIKQLFLIICTASFIYSAESGSTEFSVLETNQEIASFETPSFIQEPISSLDLPQTAPPLAPPKYKHPWLAISLSSIIPGLGHLYLGDNQTAAGLISTTGLTAGLMFSPNPNIQQTAFITLNATGYYGLYSAYRDVRLYNGASLYSYPMPTDSLADLTAASFQWSVLKKPEVWGGILGAFSIGVVVSYFAYPRDAKIETHRAAAFTPLPFVALPVGIGEECLFRGFLQSALSESFNPLTGLILSSLAFGAAHIPNAQMLDEKNRWRYYSFSLPLITGIGAYCGWLTSKNHSLKESVAVHTWYDFILFSLSALANQTAATGRPGFAFSSAF